MPYDREKIAISQREAMLAILFVVIMLAVIGMVNAGIIKNPISLGLIITLGIGLIFVGNILANKGVISRSALPLWYILVIGVAMLVYGGVQSGMIPAAISYSGASVMEVSLVNALFYTLLVVAVLAALYMFKPKILPEKKKTETATSTAPAA